MNIDELIMLSEVMNIDELIMLSAWLFLSLVILRVLEIVLEIVLKNTNEENASHETNAEPNQSDDLPLGCILLFPPITMFLLAALPFVLLVWIFEEPKKKEGEENAKHEL